MKGDAMRNMSFALTTDQVRAQVKDITRRVGWLHLKAGDLVQPVKKCMGLRPGETIERLGGPVRILSTRRELLRRMTDDLEWGKFECRREGFPGMPPAEFVAMFCRTHAGCTPDTEITRIEFSYDLLAGWLPLPLPGSTESTPIDLLVRHGVWHYAKAEQKPRWQVAVRGEWTKSSSRWTWRGLAGNPIAWRPAAV